MLEGRSSRLENAAPAIEAVGHWARQFLISRNGFEAAVTGTTREPVELVRVRWRGRSRCIVVRQALTESRARNVQEPLDPESFDPWAQSSESLAVRTLQLSRCRACGGEKRVRCLTCQGSARIPCDSCNGSGLTWSPRSRRMIGCKVCQGPPKGGQRVCSCYDGKVACEPCGGKGKVEEWSKSRRSSSIADGSARPDGGGGACRVEERPPAIGCGRDEPERGQASGRCGPRVPKRDHDGDLPARRRRGLGPGPGMGRADSRERFEPRAV